jgi:predicted ATPase
MRRLPVTGAAACYFWAPPVVEKVMNEQLVVKNFGPIKDATVDFKRVTVFIGPTGGGKSTLAKLAAVARDYVMYRLKNQQKINERYQDLTQFFDLQNYTDSSSYVRFTGGQESFSLDKGKVEVKHPSAHARESTEEFMLRMLPTGKDDVIKKIVADESKPFSESWDEFSRVVFDEIVKRGKWGEFIDTFNHSKIVSYIPAERVFAAAVSDALAGLVVANIALPKSLLEFARQFEVARKDEKKYAINLFGITYKYENGQSLVELPNGHLLQLSESASGIQTAVPMLLTTLYAGRQFRPYSFIIEEPELNLFPSAQFEVMKLLVTYCTSKSNDVVFTTHSPYVLTALNLMCYAFRIAQQDEATAKKVAQLIPRHCWIDPEQFAAYYVDRPGTKRKQQVRSIINKKTGLIEENELDTASDELSAIFDKLVKLRKPSHIVRPN